MECNENQKNSTSSCKCTLLCLRARMRNCALEISVKRMLTHTKVALVMFEQLVIRRSKVHINAQVAPARFQFDSFFFFVSCALQDLSVQGHALKI